MANNIAIRLGVEGGPELKRVFDDTGNAGQAAFQKVGAAADQAAAATDRQTAKFQRLAQAAREAEAQARAQSNVNALLGVGAGSAGSARDSASVFEAELARQDQIRAARQEQNARTSQASINTLLGVRDAQVGAARASAAAFEEAYRSETEALRRTAEARTTVIRNTVAGWRDLGTAGASQLANIEAGRRLGSLGNVPEAANQNVARRLRSDEVTNLMYQGGDVVAQLGSGSPLGMIAMQQGPQIAQIFAGPGGASVKGALGQAGEAAAGFAARIGVVGAGIGGLIATAGLGVAALISYRNSQSEVEKALTGVGRASGTTLTEINALAEGQARAGGMSRRSAREIAATYAGTGRIDPSLLGGAVSATPDFAKFLGVDRSEGATELAAALGDVSRGATDLAQRYGLLTDAQAESIRRMDAQGDRLGAQRRLLDTVRDSTRGLAEATTGWGRATEWLSNRWDDLGRVVDRAVTGGDLDTRLKTARDALAEARKDAEGANSFYRQAILDPRIATYEQQVAELEKRVGARDAVSEQVQRARRSVEVGSLVRSLDPDRAELKKLTDEGMLLRRALMDPIRFGLTPEQIEAVKRAFGDVGTQVRNLVEDIDQFGSRAVAALNRTADFNARNVGATPFGRSAAQINKEFDDKLRDAKEADRAGIEQARQKELDTLTRTQSLEQVQRGGAFSRASADLQAQILAASQRFPTVDSAMLAGLLEKEGGFWNTGPTRVLGRDGRPATTAWGRGQITDAAEKDIRGIPGMEGFDKYNVDTQVMGAAAYLSLRQRWAGGDQIKALDGYGTGPGYGIDVMRRAGTLGDASTLGVARDLDAQTQAVERGQDALRRNTELYGRNGAQLEASTRAADLYQDMLARGVRPSEALRKSLEGFAMSAEQASRATRLVQFTRDDEFARDQLGRDRIDQQAYATARARFGDTTSAEAVATIGRTRDTLGLTETKGMIVDGATSIVSEFRRTGDAASALSNAFGNAADRLLSKALDSAISSGFNSLIGSGSSSGPVTGAAGFMTSLKSFFGFSGGGYTGPGERYDVAGLVHRGEVVFSQADVARHGGVAAVEVLRRSGGLRGYADGGIVMPESFTTPSRSAFASGASTGPSFGDINITMQGATGDPATDQAHVDATMKAMRAEMVRVFHEQQNASLHTNGALWRAGVRRAR